MPEEKATYLEEIQEYREFLKVLTDDELKTLSEFVVWLSIYLLNNLRVSVHWKHDCLEEEWARRGGSQHYEAAARKAMSNQLKYDPAVGDSGR